MIWISDLAHTHAQNAEKLEQTNEVVDRLIAHGTALTVGNFDGIHLGHRHLISTLLSVSQKTNLPSVVFTFRPHPRVVLRPELPFFRLFDQLDQREVLEELGVDMLYEENFTKSVAAETASDFFETRWLKRLNVKELIVGYDFSFGKDRQGTIEFLQQICLRHNVNMTVVKPFSLNGEIVSSSTIRRLLQHGEVEKAQHFLGRQYYLRGTVVKGFQRGRVINVPTANISPDIHFLPRRGVYFTTTTAVGKTFKSITNIGFNPTFQSRNPDDFTQLKVETHIFDFDQDIYNHNICVQLHHFHRDEMKMSSIDQLKSQISIDIEACRAFFRNGHS